MTYRNKVTLVYLLGFFLDLINMFIASAAYPAIAQALHAPVAQLAWISNGYVAGLTIVIPASAWLTQRLGARRLILLALSLFSIATAACGWADSLGALVVWRTLQGAGGGLLIPVGQALAWPLFAKHERAALSCVVMLTGLLAPALSPVAGGLLAQSASWQGVFLASLPLALLALLLAFCWLKPDVVSAQKKPLDIAGLLTGTAGLFLLLFGLTRLSEADGDALAAASLAAGIMLMAFLVRRSRRHPTPLLNVGLLSDPLLRFSMGVYQCVPGLFIGVSVVGMFYLQTVIGLSAALSGALMMPWSLASLLAICVTRRMFNHTGPRPLILIGCLLQACGILLLTRTGAAHTPLFIAFFLMGAGGSLCSSTAQSSAFINTSDADMPDASALWNINRQLSFCFGVTLLCVTLNLLMRQMGPEAAYKTTFALAAALTLIPAVSAFWLRCAKPDLTPSTNKEES